MMKTDEFRQKSKQSNIYFYKILCLYIISNSLVSYCEFCYLFFDEANLLASLLFSESEDLHWCLPISSIKQHKRQNFVGLQFQFLVSLVTRSSATWWRRLRKHGASFISPTNLLSRIEVVRIGHNNSMALSIEYK